MTTIQGFHAHVYFDASTVEKARAICTRAAQELGLEMGRVHEKPVGPHPDWSCQLAFAPEKIGPVVSWLMLNRDGLVVLIHPETGSALEDHRDRAMWMGQSRPLDFSIFHKH
ncbi:MAG: DOPA 4,5-dioxygenase family protein [Proteobacteria bacterium]|nr:DOPA 4,5-dioxygenase family protein [Pseudomonadota bacterium]